MVSRVYHHAIADGVKDLDEVQVVEEVSADDAVLAQLGLVDLFLAALMLLHEVGAFLVHEEVFVLLLEESSFLGDIQGPVFDKFPS